MNRKINISVVFWILIIYFFAFERALISVSPILGYMDEILAIYTMFLLLIKIIKGNLKLNKNEVKIILLLVLCIFLGVIGNVMFELVNKTFAIIIDIISTIKVWLSFYFIIILNKKDEFYDKVLRGSASLGRLVVIIMFFCMIISMVKNIGMTGEVRFGIPSFKFVFDGPGNFSKFFYFLIPLLTADLYYKNNLKKKLYIALALLIWITTMRSRAIAFVVVYLFLAFIFFNQKIKKSGEQIIGKIKIRYLVLIGILALALCWNQMIFYFTTSTQARSVLLRYSVTTAQKYFPLGAGFGTFGSDIAATYYSKLYTEYGFNNIYGMREGEEYFLNDNYWPMTIGQFGFFGGLIFAYIIYIFSKNILQSINKNKYFYFSAFCIIIFLILSSVASKSYSEFSSICMYMLMGFFVKKERSNNKKV